MCPVWCGLVQEGCEEIKQVPWMAVKMIRARDGWAAKRICRSSVPLSFIQHRKGTLRRFFCLYSHVLSCPRNGHCLRAPSTMLSVTPDIQEFRAMSTKQSVVLPPAPFRCDQVLRLVFPPRSNFQVPGHGWMYSHHHHPKPQPH